MEIKDYNSKDKKYENVIKLLKDLPKEQASADFEFNLMTKIHNKNFETKNNDRQQVFPYWIFAPVSAVALSIVAFFTLFNFQSTLDNDQLFIQPKLNQNSSNTAATTFIENKINESGTKLEEEFATVVKPNDVVLKKNISALIKDDNSVKLDNFINKQTGKNDITGPNMLVGQGLNNFSGFLIPRNSKSNIVIDKTVDDSLKKTASNQDSLR